MPSPIAHISVACCLYNALKNSSGLRGVWLISDRLGLLVVCVVFSMLPDMDVVPGVLMRDLGAYHNHYSHSILSGCVISMILCLAILVFRKKGAASWFALSFACYVLHVVMDYFTRGRGVMLWWPLSKGRHQSPFTAFSGVQWIEGFIATEHIWTALNELVFIFILFFMVHIVHKMKRDRQD